ncbi:MAG TPA: AAA family ATPase, partial [Solimonas sp.]|nr:AAA family ATPase [Solimonas sp.]
TPYFPWRQLLVLALQDDPGADPARLREALVARIGDDRQLLDWLPLLNDVLPLQIPDNVISAQITGAARAGALQELVLQLLRRRDTALLLVLDDLHWWDEASLALLSALLPRLPQLPVVAATRPLDGSNTELPAALTRRQLRLESLSSEAAAQLAARTLGLSEGASLPPAFVDFLYQRTAGNPFFCEELSLALRDAGLIAVQGDGLRLAPEMDGDPGLSQAPTTLRGAIVSRFDRLGQAAQAALKMASVIGREFDPAALGVLLGQRELDATLEELRQADLLRSTGVPGADSAYRFKHALLRDVVYELLPFAQRRELHRKVALWIEQGPDPVSRAAELSGHWESVGDIGKALDYLERAAQHAYSHNANREAIRHVQRARGLQQQHRLELPVARQAEWEAILGDANQELFEFGRSVEHYHQALLLLRQPGSVSAARRLWLLLREAAVQFLHRLWSPAGNRSETALEQRAAHIHQRLSEIAFMGNQPAELLYRTLASVNLAESADFTYARVGGYAGLAMACVAVGRLGLAQDYSERSVRVAEAGGPADVAYAELGRMVYRITCAEWNEVHVAYAAGARLYLALGNIGRWQQICAIDAYASLLQGNYADAQHELAALAGDGGAALPPQIDAWLAGGRAWLALSRDDLAALAPALVHLEAVRQLELGHSERLLCTGLHAAALLATGEREGAERLATMALRMLREQPPIPYYLLVALSSIAEVWFRLLEDEPSPARRQLLLHRAGQTVAMSRRFSRMVPCNRPRALLLQARRAWLLGRTRAAAGYWRKALIQAQQLQMPREQAEALHALGHRVAADRAEAQDQRHRAAMLFAQLGIQPPH